MLQNSGFFLALGVLRAMMRRMKYRDFLHRMPRVLALLFLLLGAAPAWAAAGIQCHRDKYGVMNCTNIGTGKTTGKETDKPTSHSQAAASKPVAAKSEPAQSETLNAAQATPKDAPPAKVQAISNTPANTPATTAKAASTTLVYKYRQRNGVSMFTNVPTSNLQLVSTTVYQVFDKGWTGGSFKGNWKLNREAYEPLIASMAQQWAVDPALVRAVIHAESSFNPQAISRTGAMGLMQLMPGTAARFGVGNAFDPEQNIRGGVSYLRFLLDKFNGDVRLAAAGYNAGEGAVMKYGGVPPYAETTQYVARVLDLHGQYRNAP